MNQLNGYERTIIGGGQTGLVMGYQLARRGLPCMILDANERVGDSWRKRWDSLSLFTPNRFNGLPGMAVPGDRWGFPTKDEYGDFLEDYAARFDLPVRTGFRVERLSRSGDRFLVTGGDGSLEADNVVVAMASWQEPKAPEFADALASDIYQTHLADYHNPGQLRDGSVLVVGAGNSGAEIAKELAETRHVFLSGADTGVLPFRPSDLKARILMPLVGRVVFHRILTTSTPIGRRARPKMIPRGEPWVRVKPKDLAAAGVERVPRTIEVTDGLPRLEDGRILDVPNVVWCTGFHPGFSWIDLDVFGPVEPDHERGVVGAEPGLYFVGLKFLYALSSQQIHGVGRDTAHIADHIASRERSKPAKLAR
ncbi:MAG: SidA/IucD/PvdA family monooxygenase [Acidimicrobiia bacterium]|nr:SidA/IucD/PvdA family monooxygenase [Acidimicrobiia bacterium]